jgi:transcriptional regulator with XRE-family HTH domain
MERAPEEKLMMAEGFDMNDTTPQPPPAMTGSEYKLFREQLGSQQAVADLLGVDIRTIQRREAGDVPVLYESALAIRNTDILRQLRELENNLPATRALIKAAIGAIADQLEKHEGLPNP